MKYQIDRIKRLNKIVNKLEMAAQATMFEQSLRDRMLKEALVDLIKFMEHEAST